MISKPELPLADPLGTVLSLSPPKNKQQPSQPGQRMQLPGGKKRRTGEESDDDPTSSARKKRKPNGNIATLNTSNNNLLADPHDPDFVAPSNLLLGGSGEARSFKSKRLAAAAAAAAASAFAPPESPFVFSTGNNGASPNMTLFSSPSLALNTSGHHQYTPHGNSQMHHQSHHLGHSSHMGHEALIMTPGLGILPLASPMSFDTGLSLL
jgi:hypothetical protein